MLALRTARITSQCSGALSKYGCTYTAYGSALPAQSLLMDVEKAHKNFITSTTITPFSYAATRHYATEQNQQSQPAQQQKSSSSMPTPPNMPDREQLEKYFFRAIALMWDFTYWVFVLCRKNFDKYVLQNSTVQIYWKEFIHRMDKARKD